MLCADYGGEMRGGPSRASVVVGDEPLRALPVLPTRGSAILAHHRFSEPCWSGCGPAALVAGNRQLVDAGQLRGDLVGHGRRRRPPWPPRSARRQAVGFVLLGRYNAR